jgi:hypothetical protein
MSELAKRFMEHSGKDQYGNLVLLFEDKMIKMAFDENGVPLLAYKDLSRVCDPASVKANKTTFRGDFVFVDFHHHNRMVKAKYLRPSIALRSVVFRKTEESKRMKTFMMDMLGIKLPSSVRAIHEFPKHPNVVFKWVPGNPKYCVGDNGSIYSVRSKKWKQLKQFVNKDGYFSVHFISDVESVGNFKFQSVMLTHRLILLAFKGEPGPDQMACHANGIKADNRPENLRWGTAQDNADDMVKHQATLKQRPSRNGKLNEEMVREIRDLKERNVPTAAIADRFKISRGLAYKVVSGQVWNDVV